MYKVAAFITIWLALSPAWSPQNEAVLECYKSCRMSPSYKDPDIQRQEIVNLEREAANAIQHSDGTFFRRVYADDFTGTLSRGEGVNKTDFINAVQSTSIRYLSFNASDIKVRIYRDSAVATCLWSLRAVVKGQTISSQMRAIHVYINSGGGWKVIAGQDNLMPPYTAQVL